MCRVSFSPGSVVSGSRGAAGAFLGPGTVEDGNPSTVEGGTTTEFASPMSPGSTASAGSSRSVVSIGLMGTGEGSTSTGSAEQLGKSSGSTTYDEGCGLKLGGAGAGA